MEQKNINIPAPKIIPPKKAKRRRDLLPWWIVVFIWLFFVFCALMPVALIFGLLHINFELSLLGVTTEKPFSLIGAFLIVLFGFKGVVSYGLWQEQNWAIDVAKIDAIISIAICILAMIFSIFGPPHTFNIRLELLVIFPYYYKMDKLQYDWENFDDGGSIEPAEEIV